MLRAARGSEYNFVFQGSQIGRESQEGRHESPNIETNIEIAGYASCLSHSVRVYRYSSLQH